jgi:hypothetical protein
MIWKNLGNKEIVLRRGGLPGAQDKAISANNELYKDKTKTNNLLSDRQY